MIILNETTNLIAIALDGAPLDEALHVSASYVDIVAYPASYTPGRQEAVISTVALTTVVSPPAASTVRQVKMLTALNKSSYYAGVTIKLIDDPGLSTDYTVIYRAVIAPGDSIQYVDGEGWSVTEMWGLTESLGPASIYRLISAPQVLTVGSGTYYKPSNCDAILIEMVGGGASAQGSTYASPGAGAGAYARKFFSSVSASCAYVVGAAGGTASTFTNGSTTVTAPGGDDASAGNAPVRPDISYASSSGVSTNGDINSQGQSGQVGLYSGASSSYRIGGAGGSSIFGGGGRAAVNGDASDGGNHAAQGYGAGGGGCGTISNSTSSGTDGVIVIWEFTTSIPSTIPMPGRLIRAPQVLTSGTSWTKLSYCLAIIVEVVGGGGGGAGTPTTTSGNAAVGGGGGGGGYARHYFGLQSGAKSYTYSVGAGGAGGSGGANGSAGGATTFSDGTTTITANGGGGGLYQNNGSSWQGAGGGTGASVSTGAQLNGAGMPGDFALRTTANVGFSGAGAPGPKFSFGKGGDSIALAASSASNGNNATGYGAGGGGAMSNNTGSTRAGGNGSQGCIVIWEFT